MEFLAFAPEENLLIKGTLRIATLISIAAGQVLKRITRMGFTMMPEGIGGINVSLIATSGTLFLKARLDADKAQRSR